MVVSFLTLSISRITRPALDRGFLLSLGPPSTSTWIGHSSEHGIPSSGVLSHHIRNQHPSSVCPWSDGCLGPLVPLVSDLLLAKGYR